MIDTQQQYSNLNIRGEILMTLSSLRVSCDPNTISMLTFTCCNVKYDVIKTILT
jgi:hypothetical protein